MISSLLIISTILLIGTPVNGQSVSGILTTGDQKYLLQPISNLQWSQGNGPSQTKISIDPSTTYQTTLGFGGAMTDSSAWLISQMNANAQSAVLNDLFGPTGLRMSFIRVPMGSSDFALKEYTYDDLSNGKTDPNLNDFSINHDNSYIIPILQQVQKINPKVTFLASPWSPPAWMKTSNSIEGGSLIPQYYDAFANYHVKFIQAYEQQGVKISYSTIQNEPQNSAHFPTMLMSATEQRDFIKNSLGPIFAKNNIQSKVLVMDHNWDMDNYVETILNDKTASSYVAGTAFHCYNGDPSAQGTIKKEFPDKDIFFTECSGGTWRPGFAVNLLWNTETLYIDTVQNWARSIVHWNIALDDKNGPFIPGGCATCRGIVTTFSNGTYNREVEYYSIAHNSKYVDVGAARISTNSNNGDNMKAVGYLNPSGSVVVVVLNKSNQNQNFDLNWNGKHVTFAAPSQSVMTFTWANSK